MSETMTGFEEAPVNETPVEEPTPETPVEPTPEEPEPTEEPTEPTPEEPPAEPVPAPTPTGPVTIVTEDPSLTFTVHAAQTPNGQWAVSVDPTYVPQSADPEQFGVAPPTQTVTVTFNGQTVWSGNI